MNTAELLADLRTRLTNAAKHLDDYACATVDIPSRYRLSGKTEGVNLALSYLDDYRDLVADAELSPQRLRAAADAIEALNAAQGFTDPTRAATSPHYLRREAERIEREGN